MSTSVLGQDDEQDDRDDDEKRTFSEATYFGGGLGLQFGTVTNVQIMPSLGYKIDEEGRFSAGLNLLYWYFRDNRFSPAFESTNYGYGVFNRNKVIENFFTYIEFQHQSVQIGNAALQFEDGAVPREWVPFLFLGGGYAAPLGGNTYMLAQVVWEVIQDPRSPFLVGNLRGQPIFNVGIAAGF